MKKTLYPLALTVKISEAQRRAIEHHAEIKDMSLGEATREILTNGLEHMKH